MTLTFEVKPHTITNTNVYLLNSRDMENIHTQESAQERNMHMKQAVSSSIYCMH